MAVTVVLIIVALITGAVVALKVIAPATKNVVDDKVLDLLNKYAVPLSEYLQATVK